jgi:uncharacterized protein (DUF58 family)
MIPGRHLFFALWFWLVAGITTAFMPATSVVWISLGVLLASMASVDLLRMFLLKTPSVSRELPTAWPQGIEHPVTVKLTNLNRCEIKLCVFDHYPTGADVKDLPAELNIPADGSAKCVYQLRLLQRGVADFGLVQLRLNSPWKFWQRSLKVGRPEQVQVYPNYAPIMKYAILATDNRTSQMGVLRKRRRGEGLEFHQLREYRDGDVLRQVDWNATARTRKLISRQYQEERDQQILFVIDCGRRMRSADGSISHFDHALNALLLLAHVASRQGDAVGLMTSAGEQRWLAPIKGGAVLNTVMNKVFDLQPGTAAADYSSTAVEIMKRQRKRALIVWITNLRDEDSDDLLPALHMLRKKHLVLLASLREQAVYNALEQPMTDLDDALGCAAIHEYLLRRDEMHAKIRRSNIQTLDVTPQKLPVNLVNQYWDIKSSGVL